MVARIALFTVLSTLVYLWFYPPYVKLFGFLTAFKWITALNIASYALVYKRVYGVAFINSALSFVILNHYTITRILIRENGKPIENTHDIIMFALFIIILMCFEGLIMMALFTSGVLKAKIAKQCEVLKELIELSKKLPKLNGEEPLAPEDTEREDLCSICWDRSNSITFLPCKHKITCHTCLVDNLISINRITCYLCNEKIKNFKK